MLYNLCFNQRMNSCKQLAFCFRPFSLTMLLSIVFFTVVYAQSPQSNVTGSNPAVADTTKNDSTKPISLRKPKQSKIDAIITYNASDSIVFMGNGTGFLHGNTDIKYKTIDLQADYVRVKMDSSLVYARGVKDSTGVLRGNPVFKEGEKSYDSKEITYNLKTKKGFIRNAVTKEGEGFILSDKTKRTDDEALCIAGGKYTTCEDHDHPHFYLSMSRGKVKPGEYVVTGPAHLVVADVPLPIALPFGFFPFTQKYSSGFIMPSYTTEQTRGFGLTGMGWYFAVSDFMDLEVKSDVYTKGTWSLSAATNYVKRYKYRGSLSMTYRNDVTGEKGLDKDYSVANNFNVQWSHSQDTKANPNFTFSSSVNFSTSGYNRSNVNSYYNPALNSENTKSSSINFSKRFPTIPSLSINGSFQITQQTKDSTMSITLPDINVTYSRFFPFKRKNAVGNERWYEKISMQYSGAISNQLYNFKENKVLQSSLSKDWRNGVKHAIPVSASFNLLKYINVSPSFNYTERWYFKSIDKSWDKTNQKEIIQINSGFYRVFDYNMGVSATTKLYGFYTPIFKGKVEQIRHILTPSIGFGYTPDFSDSKWGYWDSYMKSVRSVSNPNVYVDSEYRYSRFEGSRFGAPGAATSTKSGSINFSLTNNVEMKVRNDKDTTGKEPSKKISLIDNFSVAGGYNLAVDSMNWSAFSSSIRLRLSKDYTLNLSTTFDPYMYGLNSSGNPVRVNKLRWNYGKFPAFMGTSTSFSYTLNNDTFRKLFGKKEKSKPADDAPKGSETPDSDTSTKTETAAAPAKAEIDGDGYSKVEVPWSLNLSYSLSYGSSGVFNKDKMEYEMELKHNLTMSGNISLSKNWRINFNPSFDIATMKFTYLSMGVVRPLHCWTMSANIVPFGPYKSYNFHIGVNSSMLADLKYDKQSEYGRNKITWY